MEKNVTVVGVLHIGIGVVGIFIALIVLVTLLGAGLIAGDELVMSILTTIAVIVTIFLGVLSLPEIIGGIGLIKYQSWARFLVMILSVLNLIVVPIGTVIGAYSLWALMQDEIVVLFNKPADLVD